MVPSHVAATGQTRDYDQPIESYTTQLHKNDVLLGRGVPVFNYSGNIRFRQIISEFKPRYSAASKHKMKNKITREIIEVIENSNGRFVREVKTSAEAASLCITRGTKAWAIVDEDAKILKVKQALREPNLKEDSSDTNQQELDSQIERGHQDMSSDQMMTPEEKNDAESTSSLSRSHEERDAIIASLLSSQQQFNSIPTATSVGQGQLDSRTLMHLLRLQEQQRQTYTLGDNMTNILTMFGHQPASHSVLDTPIFQANCQQIDDLLASRGIRETYAPDPNAAMGQQQRSLIELLNELNRRLHQSESSSREPVRTQEQLYLEALSSMIQHSSGPNLNVSGSRRDDVGNLSYFNLTASIQNHSSTQESNEIPGTRTHVLQSDGRLSDHVIADRKGTPNQVSFPVDTTSSNEDQKQEESSKRMGSNTYDLSAYPGSHKKR